MFEYFAKPEERELDMLQLTLLVFLPAIFALFLLIVPGTWKRAMRWLALFGAAFTLSLSLCTLVDYHRLLDSRSDRTVRSFYHPSLTLDARSDTAREAATSPVPKPFDSFDLVARRAWISKFNIEYALGIDGINLSLVILTAVVTFFAVIASWKIETNVRAYLMLLLTLETGVVGAFLSLDLFLFYVFYEVMLFPMYFLIGLWGGQRRKFAAIKFVIYTLLGSVGLLAAMIALYTVDVRDFVPQTVVQSKENDLVRDYPGITVEDTKKRAEIHTFDIATLSRMGRAVMLILTNQEKRLVAEGDTTKDTVPVFAKGVNVKEAIERLKSQRICTSSVQYTLFILMFLAFAVKVPIVPLHSWLPDAHVEAPTPISMILAGVLLKLGGYGLIRFAFPICPWAAYELAWWIGLIGVIGIVYGALVAMGQTDFKKLLAYSSVSHMGYVLLGLSAWSNGVNAEYWSWGVNGALFQMLAHGITASALFFVVGVVYDRAHHRELNRLGGLKEPMPVYSGLAAVLFFASMGLPGLCGFVGEFQVVVAAWKFSWGLALFAILATILTAAYLLWAWQRVFLGVNSATATYPEIDAREASVLIPFVILSIVFGVIPGILVFSWTEPSVAGWVQQLSVLTPR